MKNTKTLLALLTLFAFLPAPPWAAETLTWDACVKEASTHNLDLLTAEQSVKALENSKIASLGQFLPQINFGASLGRGGQDNSLEGALNDPNYQSSANLSLSATENIFSGLKDVASVDAANANLDLAKAQLSQAKAQLSHDLKTDFYQLLFSQKQIDLLQNIVDRQKANLDLVEMNFKGGTDNKGSFLQAEAAWEEAKFEFDQAKRGLRVAQRQLDQVLGRGPMDEIEIQGGFEVPTLADSMPEFTKLTLETPAHKESLAQLHLSESGYVTARSYFFPTLSANASLYRDGNSLDNLNSPGWNAGLSFNFPLFTGGKDFFNLKSAEESKYGAEDSLKSADLKTESQLESAYASYANAIEQTAVLQTQLVAVQTQEEIAKAEYLNGLLIFVNWNQIETNLTNQEKAQLSGLLNEKTAEATWELTQGKGVIP